MPSLATVCAIFALLLGALPGTSAAGVPAAPPLRPTMSKLPPPRIDPGELAALLDPWFRATLTEKHIPGAVFVLVKDGQVLFSKGYGLSDLARGTPVDPGRTVFRVDSVSKLFTATAVMQLVEQGKIRLSDDVNRYLKTFQIAKTFAQPITIANLLNHTAGFEERGIGRDAPNANAVRPLGEYLATHIPRRVVPTGTIISYSPYSAGLAGYIVEQVSGVPFAQYIAQNIFQLLGMTSSFTPEARLIPDLATGYRFAGDHYSAGPMPFYYTNNAPLEG